MTSSVVLIKLGGSLITNKSKPFSERRDVIVDLVGQVKDAWKEGEKLIVVGHGGGSYPHVPAEKYRTIEGKVNGQSVYGAAMVEDAAAQLNRIVVGEFLKQKLPAVSLNPSSCLTLENREVKAYFSDSLRSMLDLKMIPVIYGDTVFDSRQGFTIWSTEQLLGLLAEKLLNSEFAVEKIIHCGETDGFLVDGEVLSEITKKNFKEVKKSVHATEGFDVTGGMLHKIEEALATAEKGVDSYIVGGNHGGNLYRAIVGGDFIGTKIGA